MIHYLRVRHSSRKLLVFLMRQAIMTSELRAGGREDLGLHAGEGGCGIDRIADSRPRGKLFQLSATHEKEQTSKACLAKHGREE